MAEQNKLISRFSAHFFVLSILYFLTICAYVLYSYTQIDLGLTLSRSGVISQAQRAFQQIGFFNRPLSVAMYLTILTSLFILYAYVIHLAYRHRLGKKQCWFLIGLVVATTAVAYPAFSYDFFNYLFTAKTVLIYHKNPYVVIPLQFAGVDPWLSFMHWTHLPSAYTPLWIGTSLLPYLFGFGKLLLLIINLKIYIALAYVLTIYGIGKVLRDRGDQVALIGMVLFAFNPLVITESLISPHNDIVMMAISIWSIVLYQQKYKLASWFVLSLSIAMKLMTIFLIPVFIMKWNKKLALGFMLLGLVLVILQREVLSWYWIWIIPFVALLPEYPSIMFVSFGISMGLLLRYVPFLYLGHWNNPAPIIKLWVTFIPIITSMAIAILIHIKNRKPNKV